MFNLVGESCESCWQVRIADLLLAMAFATQGLMTVASRIVMSTARDGLYGSVSPHLARVHPRLAVSTTSSERLGS
jgi:hypothetical protein